MAGHVAVLAVCAVELVLLGAFPLRATLFGRGVVQVRPIFRLGAAVLGSLLNMDDDLLEVVRSRVVHTVGLALALDVAAAGAFVDDACSIDHAADVVAGVSVDDPVRVIGVGVLLGEADVVVGLVQAADRVLCRQRAQVLRARRQPLHRVGVEFARAHARTRREELLVVGLNPAQLVCRPLVEVVRLGVDA